MKKIFTKVLDLKHWRVWSLQLVGLAVIGLIAYAATKIMFGFAKEMKIGMILYTVFVAFTVLVVQICWKLIKVKKDGERVSGNEKVV